MKSKVLSTLVLSLLISLTLNLPHAISQGMLHDDFKKTTIDPLKWDSWEVVREIQQFPTVKGGPTDGKLVSKVTAYGYKINNWLNFKNPNTIKYIEADVTVNSIADKYKTEENHVIPRARLVGFFYNDGRSDPGSGDLTGEVQGAIAVRKYKGKLEVHWGVIKFQDDAGEIYETLMEGTLPVKVALKQIYRLFIQFDPGSKTFTFGVIAAKGKPLLPPLTDTFTTTDSINLPGGPWKAVGTQVWFAPLASSLSGSISATFDNVVAKAASGDVLVTEDFSSSPLDATKWNTQEFVREAPKGKLRSELRRANGGDSNGLNFKNPQKVKDFRANVTLNNFVNPNACNTRARLGGYFYNADGPPDPARGYQGEVWADISIGGTGTSGTSLTANWSVWRSTTIVEGGGWANLGSDSFPVTINLDQTYNLSIGWDGTKIMFGITENENTYTDEYTIATAVYPPNNNNKGLSTRISPPSSPPASYEASISATFDDVIINQTGLPLDGSWLFDMSGGGAKGGAIFSCFQNKFEGYGFGGGPFKIKGNYTVDSLGVVNADYTVYDWDGTTVDDSGTLTGTVDTKITKVNLTVAGQGVKLLGVPLPSAPVIPRDWTVKVSPGGDIFDTFTIEPLNEGQFYPRVFIIYGEIYDPDVEDTIKVEGGFFLGQKNKLYGDYTVYAFDDDGNPDREDGILSGTITLSPSAKFTMTAVSDDKRSRATLKGIPK